MSEFRGKIVEKAAGTGGRPEGELPTAGMHGAVIVAVVDLGTHPDKFEDKDTGRIVDYNRRRLLLAVELTGKSLSDKSGNWVFAREFTLSFKEGTNLVKLASAVLGLKKGQEFDVEDLLGKGCSAKIELSEGKTAGKFYANLKAIEGRAEGLAIKKNKCEPFIWTFEMGTPPNLPLWIPQWVYGNKVLDIISDSIEGKGSKKTAAASNRLAAPPTWHANDSVQIGVDDDLPF